MRRSLVPIAVVAAVALVGCGSGPPQLPVNAAGASRNETAAADMSMKVANIRYELADGVKADKDHQNAYKFASATLDDAKRVAKAFGVTGTVHADEYGWTVGSTGEEPVSSDGTTTKQAVSLYMGKNGSFSMSGSYPVSSGVACAEPDLRDNAVDTVPCETTTTTINPNLPSEAEAKKIASDALKAAGVDVDGMKVTVEQFDQVVSVRFQPTFEGGLVDGVEHGVTVGPNDVIAYASGFVGDAKSVGSYELATLQRAVDRLDANSVYPAGGDDVRTLEATEPAPDIFPIEDPEGTDQTEPTVVKLTGVRVGLMMTTDDDQSLWLTPAYVFDTDEQGNVTTPAAHDKYLPPPTTTPPSDGDDPGQTDVPPASDGGSGGGGGSSDGNPGTGAPCATNPAGPSEGTNQPITAQVCASAAEIKAGTEVVFTLTFSDPDRAFVEGPCGDAVSPNYGDDGSNGEARCLACPVNVGDGPGKGVRERKHTYNKPGNYTATFTIKSGNACGPEDPHDSTATVSVPIKVV